MGYFRRSGRIISIVAMVCGLAAPGFAVASTAADNTNSLIPGGCTTRAICTQKISASDLRSFYTAHGVTAATLHDSVGGSVTKTGLVIVDGKTVATHALSFGRTSLPGSTAVGSLFRRPTSVSFATSQLPALVHLTNGRFDFAIIESCGNLVVATPVVVATTQHTKVVTKVVTTTPVINNTVSVTNVNNNTNQAPPTTVAATPAPTPAPAAAVTPLPQTGASAIGLAGLSTLLVVAGYYWRSRRGLQFALRRG